MSVKVTFNLSDLEIAFVQNTAKREGVTFTDILMRAINSEKFFCEQEALGNKILVERDGRLYEVTR